MHSQRSSFINFTFMSMRETRNENTAKNKASIFKKKKKKAREVTSNYNKQTTR